MFTRQRCFAALVSTVIVTGLLAATNAAAAPSAPRWPVYTQMLVGRIPQTPVIDTVRGVAFVANQGSSLLSVIANNGGPRVLTTVPLLAGAQPPVLDTARYRLYLPISEQGYLTVVNTETFTSVVSIQVGKRPGTPALDQATGLLYVPNADSGTVSVINTLAVPTPTVVAEVRVGLGPVTPVLDVTRGLVFVVNSGSGSVSVIDADTNTVMTEVAVGSNPTVPAFDERSGKLFVANSGSGTVSVIDTISNSTIKQVASIPVGSGPGRPLLNASATLIYVPNAKSGSVSVISTRLLRVTTNVKVGGTPVALALDGAGILYVADYTGDRVVMVEADKAAPKILAATPVAAAPVGLAIDPPRKYLYVSSIGRLGTADPGVVSVIRTTPR